MTKENIQFISDNLEHIKMVVEHNQTPNSPRGHNVGKTFIEIAEDITGKPIDHCSSCYKNAYIAVWNAYKEETKTKK